jgi:hypothetical protein
MAVIQVGDDLFDEETGEYAGSAHPGWLPTVLETEDDLINYMRILMEAESSALAEEMKYKTVVSNVQKIVKRKTSKVKYLRDMYQGQVKKLVEDILPRDRDGNFRTKTYRNPWGKVSLRETKTKLAISDNMMAMRFAHLECPSAIKTTESILISMIPDDVKEKLFTDASVAEAFGFHVIEGDNTVSITTIEGTKDEAS